MADRKLTPEKKLAIERKRALRDGFFGDRDPWALTMPQEAPLPNPEKEETDA